MKMLEALKNYQQTDEDGVMVLVSRQALDEAICLLGEARKTVWLIEWPEDDNVPVRWWNPATGWMRDANKAMWLARESDATDYIASHKLVSGIKPTEHIFVGISGAAQASPDQRLTEDMTLAHNVRLATIEECARELECSYPRKNPPLNSYCARIRALSAVTPSPAQPPRTPLDLSAGELNTLATDAFREAAQGSAVAWTGEYDGHLDATIYRDTMERWKALGRKITPLYAVTPSPGAREETDEQLDERLAKQEARENLRLLDHIAHKIGLPIDQELSRENFNSWLSSVPSTDRGGK